MGEDEERSDEFDLRPPCPELLAGPLPDFEILEVIGSGGMGKVYKAKQPNLERIVALKVLSGAVIDSEEHRFSDRFRREASVLARLRHPNIVSFYHYGETEEGQIYFMMEYIEGTELSSYIHSGEAEPRHILYWAIQTCAALQFAHENGIVHRDIKPSNLLVDEKGNIKIADFGLAKFSPLEGGEVETQLTRTDIIVGTPNYIAPELIEDPTAVSPSADIYSLGVTFYQALTGVVPRGMPSSPSQIVPGLDPRWDGILFRCLSSSPEERFSSASELQEAFEEMLDGSDLIPLSSLRKPLRESPGNSPSQPWLRVLAPVLAIAAVLLVSGIFLSGRKGPEDGVESPPPISDQGKTIPRSIPLQIAGPLLPSEGGKLAILSFGEEPGSARAIELLSQEESPVRIWRQPGSDNWWGLTKDGSVWSSSGSVDPKIAELSDLVWLAPGEGFVGALGANGQVFHWKEKENRSPIVVAADIAMIAAGKDGEMLLLGRDGMLRRSEEGGAPSSVPVEMDEASLAIGAEQDLFATLGRNGSLRVWQAHSGLAKDPVLLFERLDAAKVRRDDSAPTVYPDRWIPLFSWGVVDPGGRILPFEDGSAVAPDLPSLATIEQGTFQCDDTRGGGHFLRDEVGWQFFGEWQPHRLEILELLSRGARTLHVGNNSVVVLVSPEVEIEASLVRQGLETEKPDSETEVQVWSGKRIEIHASGSGWEEASIRPVIDAIDFEVDRMETILAMWGAGTIPGKLVLVEGESLSNGNGESDPIPLSLESWDRLVGAAQAGEPLSLLIDSLPPEVVFRSQARKLGPEAADDAFFGNPASHLAEFFRLFAHPDSDEKSARWEASKTFVAERIAAADYLPEGALNEAGNGGVFFAGLLARLHDDHGGAEFLERFFREELAKRPDALRREDGIDSFVLAASIAAAEDLLPLFRDELRWPVSAEAVASIVDLFPPASRGDESVTDFRPAPDMLLKAWEENYLGEILPRSVDHRTRLAELRAQYGEALERKATEHEVAGRTAAAQVYRDEKGRVGPGYGGPRAFHPTIHKALGPEAQQAVRELYGVLGRTYRERVNLIANEATSSTRGRLTGALDELYRLQHLFTLDGKDDPAQWALDRRLREVGIFSLDSVYSPRLSLDFDLRYEEMIRWAVEEGAAVDVVHPITPTQVQRYTVRSVADIQAGRFVWQRLRIVGIQRGAAAKPWTDIHLQLVSHFKDLERLECEAGELRAATLERIADLERLESLSLSGVTVSASETEGLVALSGTELKKLNLAGATLPEGSLLLLAAGPIARTLEEMSLANTDTADILPLGEFRRLERLDITGCGIPQENIEEFTRKMRDCTVVR